MLPSGPGKLTVNLNIIGLIAAGEKQAHSLHFPWYKEPELNNT
jgi:hypothetical protein